MKQFVRPVLIVAIVLLGVIAIYFSLTKTWAAYGQCTSRDVLQWDGNTRYTTVFDQYMDVQDGHALRAIAVFFEGDNWPPLRIMVDLAVFLLSPSGPGTILETGITFVTWILVLVSILAISLLLAKDRLGGALAFLFTAAMLLHGYEIPGYSVAAMLEDQGMLFILWSCYFLFRLYEAGDKPISTGTKAGTFAAIFGVFFTKYPYGIMLLIAVVAYEVAVHPKAFFNFAMYVFRNHYRGVRLVLIFALAALVAGLFAAGSLGIKNTMNQKTVKYIIYAVFVITFIDFNVYLWRFQKNASVNVPQPPVVLSRAYVFGFFPGILWIFLHPDRLSAILDAHLWSMKQLDSYIFSFLFQNFDSPLAVFILIVAAGAGAYAVFRASTSAQNSTDRAPGASGETGTSVISRLSTFFEKPIIAAGSIALLMLILQDVLSSNKQYRHTYHILPALILFLSLWAVEWPEKSWRYISGGILAVLSVVLFFRPEGVFTSTYTAKRQFCYTGTDPSLYDRSRWAARQIDPTKKYILINAFHGLPPDPQSRNPAAEIDVLLRSRLEGPGRLRNDNTYRWKNWSEFDTLLVVADVCGRPELQEKITRRAASVGVRITKTGAAKELPGKICMETYSIQSR